MVKYNHIEDEVPGMSLRSCLQWAFGDDYNDISTDLWPDRWNERHCDLFIMHLTDEVEESLNAIRAAFLSYKKRERRKLMNNN